MHECFYNIDDENKRNRICTLPRATMDGVYGLLGTYL